tara:strand:- start:43 stop:237 length:195 start_codon:yes stop_codon:yes gene_type:complete
MGLLIRKVEGGYSLQVSPPEARKAWASTKPLTYKELIRKSNDLRLYAQDFWDAAVEADPELRNT